MNPKEIERTHRLLDLYWLYKDKEYKWFINAISETHDPISFISVANKVINSFIYRIVEHKINKYKILIKKTNRSLYLMAYKWR